MNIKNVLSKVDHTLLRQTATENEIQKLCIDGVEFGVAAVCVSPCFVGFSKKLTKNSKTSVCTVVGFPNGYNTLETKIFETENALNNGVDEIDMVINLSFLKDKKYREIENEIKKVKEICGKNILKVIVETCLLSEDEKIKMCKIVTNSGADYIKTSTGFSTGGATPDDIKLFKKYVGKNVKIKAAGGIKTLEDAQNFINLGAERLGTSQIVKLISSDS